MKFFTFIGVASLVLASIVFSGCDDDLSPEVKQLNVPESVERYRSVNLSVTAKAQMGSISSYLWSVDYGSLSNENSANATYTADTNRNEANISVNICDSEGECSTKTATIKITENQLPVIEALNVPEIVESNSTNVKFSVLAREVNNEEMKYTYFWQTTVGSFDNNLVQSPIFRPGVYIGSAQVEVKVCNSYLQCVSSGAKTVTIK